MLILHHSVGSTGTTNIVVSMKKKKIKTKTISILVGDEQPYSAKT